MSWEQQGEGCSRGQGDYVMGRAQLCLPLPSKAAAALWTRPLAPKSWVFLASPHSRCAGGVGTASFSFPRPRWGRLLTSYHTGKGWCTPG